MTHSACVIYALREEECAETNRGSEIRWRRHLLAQARSFFASEGAVRQGRDERRRFVVHIVRTPSGTRTGSRAPVPPCGLSSTYTSPS